MPELPEVESIRLQLDKFLIGHKIDDIEVRDTRIFPDDKSQVIGAKFLKARRFAKVLVLDLDNSKSLMIHVKMTGQLIYRGPNLVNVPELSKKVSDGLGGKHTHVIFTFDNEGKLYYNDFRRFGWIKIVDTNLIEQTGLVGKMGPEPFSSTQGKPFSLEYFKQMLSKTRRPIKVVIMDQEKIGGVGNIYANDALYLAKILPSRPANSLNPEEQQNLYNAIHEVLKEGLKYGGSSENTFVTPDGTEGQYQRHTLIYGKTGKNCTNCGEKILRSMIGGRGTFYCANCQK